MTPTPKPLYKPSLLLPPFCFLRSTPPTCTMPSRFADSAFTDSVKSASTESTRRSLIVILSSALLSSALLFLSSARDPAASEGNTTSIELVQKPRGRGPWTWGGARRHGPWQWRGGGDQRQSSNNRENVRENKGFKENSKALEKSSFRNIKKDIV